MHKGMFTEEELRHLRSLDAVERAEPLRITCSKEFKREFMRRCHEGERPRAIFESAGLKAEPIGCKRIERACAHWREAETKDAPCLADGKNPTRDGMRARERMRAREMRCHQGVQGQEGRRDGGEAGKAEAAGQDARGEAHRLAGRRDRRAEGAGEGLKGTWRAGEGGPGAHRRRPGGRRGPRRPSGSGPMIPHPA